MSEPIKPVIKPVKWTTYIDFNKESDKEDPKFETNGHVRISKYENIFAKDFVPNWYKEGLRLKKLKILCQGHTE